MRAWLFTVARNAYYDHCRRAKHAAPLEDAETKAADSPDIAQLLVDKDAAFTVHQCLHALEEPYKEVFSLRVFGELPLTASGRFWPQCRMGAGDLLPRQDPPPDHAGTAEMIGNAHRANPLSHALRRASSPERGSFLR